MDMSSNVMCGLLRARMAYPKPYYVQYQQQVSWCWCKPRNRGVNLQYRYCTISQPSGGDNENENEQEGRTEYNSKSLSSCCPYIKERKINQQIKG